MVALFRHAYFFFFFTKAVHLTDQYKQSATNRKNHLTFQ